ncbi:MULTISPECIES: porin [unclassified Microbulbifer]|uniref:OprO/OprP family phosphate-selective porin n=1 Tax=unclassified Microbulbifer TaxID=2619833 RepID=UPI0027E3C85E|nr:MULTISPECIES: porin [unclassified Microbulbifer]
MNKLAKISALAGVILCNPAVADKAETKGGLKITSDDGNFSAALGGRIHFDTYLFDEDIEDTISTTEFRRARITLSGEAYNWKYKLEQDFAAGSTLSGFRDVYIATGLAGGTLTIGQFKPYRSMEELTSSNEITMMERPFTSGTGIYRGRQFQQGVGWHTHVNCYTFGIMAINLRDAGTPRNEGLGAASRFTWTPINDDMSTLHFGISLSHEDANRNTEPLEAEVIYAGRRGPRQLIALTPGGDNFFFGDFGDDEFFIDDGGGTVNSAGLELAGTYGPLYGQAEYVYADYDGDYFLSELTFVDFFGVPAPFACDPVTGCFIDDQHVDAWYVMGSWIITGEHKPYNAGKAVFKSPKPEGKYGAWELTARYDIIRNRDIHDLKASSLIFGLNYYVNPRVRFMLNATFGDDDFTGDKTNQLAIRAQMYW